MNPLTLEKKINNLFHNELIQLLFHKYLEGNENSFRRIFKNLAFKKG